MVLIRLLGPWTLSIAPATSTALRPRSEHVLALLLCTPDASCQRNGYSNTSGTANPRSPGAAPFVFTSRTFDASSEHSTSSRRAPAGTASERRPKTWTRASVDSHSRARGAATRPTMVEQGSCASKHGHVATGNRSSTRRRRPTSAMRRRASRRCASTLTDSVTRPIQSRRGRGGRRRTDPIHCRSSTPQSAVDGVDRSSVSGWSSGRCAPQLRHRALDPRRNARGRAITRVAGAARACSTTTRR